MADRYVNLEQVINNIDNGGLLVGNNAEWAKEAVYKADYVDMDYYIPCKTIDDAKKHCQERLDYYSKLGSIAKVEFYTEFIQTLNSMWVDPDVSVEE